MVFCPNPPILLFTNCSQIHSSLFYNTLQDVHKQQKAIETGIHVEKQRKKTGSQEKIVRLFSDALLFKTHWASRRNEMPNTLLFAPNRSLTCVRKVRSAPLSECRYQQSEPLWSPVGCTHFYPFVRSRLPFITSYEYK